MKLISFAVPCYNSQDYMRKCIDSLLTGGDDVEIIIVNDGSRDKTLDIAMEYEREYPGTVKVIDKQNGGHGSGVNAGLQAATGLYYKVVDSDDWLDENALAELIAVIKEHSAKGKLPDLYITNFVYEHTIDNTRYVSSYEKKFPVRVFADWKRVKRFRLSHMLLMHALTYKREKLLESDTWLPEHTFYVDNLFAYKPLPYMKSIYYLDVDLYRYFIGRADQSINRDNFVKRYDQQIRVMRRMIDAYSWDELKKLPKGLKRYMWHSLVVIMMNTIFFTCAADAPERRDALRELWLHIKRRDIKLYRKLRRRSYTTAVNYMPWKMRAWVMGVGYDILCKKIKLG